MTAATTDAPAKKRPRTRRTPIGALAVPTRHATGLSPFNGISVDVFLEIASLLQHPRDLLSLARVSKRRSILFSRRHRSLWTAALSSIPDLPPCPDDMSEPSYAALLFDKICLLCVVNRSTHVDFALRLRLCTACYNENVQKGNRFLEEQNLSHWLGEYAFGMVPCEVLSHSGSSLERWGEAVRQGAQAKEDPDNHKGSDKYYIPVLKAVIDKYRSFPSWSEEQKAYRAEQEAKTRKIHKHATELILWEKITRIKKEYSDTASQLNRAASISKKLEELGYQEADWPNSPAWSKLVMQTKPLTDRIWNNIRPKLIVMLEEERQRRVQVARQQRVLQRMIRILQMYEAFVANNIPPASRPLMPNARDASQLPSLVELVSRNDGVGEVTPLDFFAVAPQLLDEVDAYKERARNVMLEDMRRDPKVRADLEGVSPEAALERHYALFACYACTPALRRPSTIMYWPEIHAHWRTVHWGKSWFPDASKQYDRDLPGWMTMHTGKYGVEVLDAVGLSKNTPLGTLDGLIRAGRLYCACGDPSLPPPPELTWKELVDHVLRNCYQYKCRAKKLRLDMPIRGLVLKPTHQLEGPDCCIKYTPPPEDPSPAAFHRTTISPELRTRVEARLLERPEPNAVALCRICQRLTRRKNKPPVDGEMKLPATPEGIVWHVRGWHEKEFREDDIAFTTDYLSLW